jgi:pantoate--beta-alanine ligase
VEFADRMVRLRGMGAVALVPTMGAVHDGHAALVRAARKKCQRVVATVFVNPTQFGPTEDFAAYPRDEAGDAAKFEAAGAHLLYAPSVAEVYPKGPQVTVKAGPLADVLEGRFRPGHFDGVATVVSTLFDQAKPDVAVFGEKDYQQLLVIREVERARGSRVEILAVPTERAADGLALSSRNAYLSPAERRVAPTLNRTLSAIAQKLSDGGSGATPEIARGTAALVAAGFKVDYLAVCDADTLQPIETVAKVGRVLAAVRLGRTRLIDNVPIVTPEP